MKKTNYGFMASIFAAFVIVQFDFDNLKFETPWKGILFLIGFIVFAILAFINKGKV